MLFLSGCFQMEKKIGSYRFPPKSSINVFLIGIGRSFEQRFSKEKWFYFEKIKKYDFGEFLHVSPTNVLSHELPRAEGREKVTCEKQFNRNPLSLT